MISAVSGTLLRKAMARLRPTHDQVILGYALLAGLPAVVIAVVLLWQGDYTPRTRWTLGLLAGVCWIGFAMAARARVIRPLMTMSNLISAVREGDYSIRARGVQSQDPLGGVFYEINQLANLFQEQRLGALEAAALLHTVMEVIDVAVFAFDGSQRLRLVNRAGERLLAAGADRLLTRSAAELGLDIALEGDPVRVLTDTRFPGGAGRWGLRRTSFREKGRPHDLVVITDLSQALRAEETKAWQRLVRVLGHELNNSLAPIKSLAGSLGALFSRPKRADDWENDMRSGLEIIASRAEGLTRFMQAYSQFARLPPPTLASVEIGCLMRHVAGLERRLSIQIMDSPELTVRIDSAQIQQVMVNLLKNAVEAALEQNAASAGVSSGVRLSWQNVSGVLEVRVEDDGPGIANPANLFVPFFTTKPSGSGIGLVLSRQIAENHGGSLTLENRNESRGCIAALRLPV